MKKTTNFLYILLTLGCVFVPSVLSKAEVEYHKNILVLKTLYGDMEIQEPVFQELIQSAPFARLQNIAQYGLMYYSMPALIPNSKVAYKEYDRYTHSLGVFFLARKYGAPVPEQIAALLHDVSHTVFSHVGDALFGVNVQTSKTSYQDDIHEWYIEASGLQEILEKHGYAEACSEKVHDQYKCYDQDLPDLCADRLEYNLMGGFIDGYFSEKEIALILRHLHFEEGKWFFDDRAIAKKFALVTLALSENRWGGPFGKFIDHHAAHAMKRAWDLGVINHHDIHFSHDKIIWQKLCMSADEEIKEAISCIMNCKEICYISSENDYDLHLRGKFSGTDPYVRVNESLVRLSHLDEGYKKEFERVREKVKKGFYIKIMK